MRLNKKNLKKLFIRVDAIAIHGDLSAKSDSIFFMLGRIYLLNMVKPVVLEF